jgi:hypothetical protein
MMSSEKKKKISSFVDKDGGREFCSRKEAHYKLP